MVPERDVIGDPTEVVGRRFLAGLIDLAILGALFIVMSLLTGGAEGSDGQVNFRLDGGWFAAYIGLALGYYYGTEASSGQTLGKRVLGLRVIREDGQPAAARSVLLRTLGRIIDVLPFLYVLGAIVLLANKRQRIGDMFGGTTVVADRG